MKKAKILIASGLAGFGLALVVPWQSHSDATAQSITTVAIPEASPPVPVAAEKQQATSPAPVGNADDKAIKALVDLNRDLAEQHQRNQLAAQRNREEWKQRWNEDTEKLRAELAASALKVQDAEREAAASDARLKQTLADAKAEVEREKREQAAQAAAAVTAPLPTPPKPGVTDF